MCISGVVFQFAGAKKEHRAEPSRVRVRAKKKERRRTRKETKSYASRKNVPLIFRILALIVCAAIHFPEAREGLRSAFKYFFACKKYSLVFYGKLLFILFHSAFTIIARAQKKDLRKKYFGEIP